MLCKSVVFNVSGKVWWTVFWFCYRSTDYTWNLELSYITMNYIKLIRIYVWLFEMLGNVFQGREVNCSSSPWSWVNRLLLPRLGKWPCSMGEALLADVRLPPSLLFLQYFSSQEAVSANDNELDISCLRYRDKHARTHTCILTSLHLHLRMRQSLHLRPR